MTPPSVIVLATFIDDTHTRMDRLEQRVRQMRVFDSAPGTKLPPDFKMLEIERYTSKG